MDAMREIEQAMRELAEAREAHAKADRERRRHDVLAGRTEQAVRDAEQRLNMIMSRGVDRLMTSETVDGRRCGHRQPEDAEACFAAGPACRLCGQHYGPGETGLAEHRRTCALT